MNEYVFFDSLESNHYHTTCLVSMAYSLGKREFCCRYHIQCKTINEGSHKEIQHSIQAAEIDVVHSVKQHSDRATRVIHRDMVVNTQWSPSANMKGQWRRIPVPEGDRGPEASPFGSRPLESITGAQAQRKEGMGQKGTQRRDSHRQKADFGKYIGCKQKTTLRELSTWKV